MSESDMMLASLHPVHHCPGRVRWRYQPGRATLDEAALTLAIRELAGVNSVRLNRRACSLIVEFDEQALDALQLGERILALNPAPRAHAPLASEPATSRTRLAANVAAMLGVNLLPIPLRLPLSLLMTLPVLRHGVGELTTRGLTSHVLEAMAVSISLASRDYLAANTTAFMLELGEYLEDSISRRSDDMLRDLLKPSSDEIWVERDGVEVQVPASEVAVGDTVIVGTGMVVPVDGTVLGGEAFVNEASMTGESRAVAKQRGDAVLSGTVLEDGRIRIYAEHVGQRTAAARIADYVQQSLTAKSEVQLQASQLADQLVPRVLGLATGAFLLTGDGRRSAAVLQADYSCALKLATPVAFKSAMYAAGKAGILIKGATALERLAEADTFIFDKTGTLTNGDLVVTDSVTFDNAYSADDLICLAASVEEHYFHPLAIAVVEASRSIKGRHFDHTEVEFIVAHGVASEIDGKRIVVGSRHFVEEDEGIDISRHQAALHQLYLEGKTLLYIGYGGNLIGVIALRDTVRHESAATLARLRASGVKRILLLTGDHHDRAMELAEQLGIDEVFAQLLPEDKASIIEELTAQGARIAFVGDGINDAPALAGAHVGIAMQRGADIARISADIALLKDDISAVAQARELSCSAMSLIHDNYRLTLGANTAILGAAAVGLLSPIAASVLHNGTTIGILLNALRGRQA